jgi:hypothetical protein
MKKIAIALTPFVLVPFFGYYEHHEEIESFPVAFLKKAPTLQLKFYRVFHPNFEKNLSELSGTQRQKVIDYCKYRLGIETLLETEEELRSCQD